MVRIPQEVCVLFLTRQGRCFSLSEMIERDSMGLFASCSFRRILASSSLRSSCRLQQDRERRPALNSQRLPQAQDALDPAVAALAGRAETTLAPDHREPDHPFGTVLRRRNTGLLQKQPQMLRLPLQTAQKPASAHSPASRSGAARRSRRRGPRARFWRPRRRPRNAACWRRESSD